MATHEIVVRLFIESDDDDGSDALEAVNQALDAGVLQDAINEDDDNHDVHVVSALAEYA